MAKAKQIWKKIKKTVVKKELKLNEINLTLTLPETRFLIFLLSKVGGCPKTSGRVFASSIYESLRTMGVGCIKYKDNQKLATINNNEIHMHDGLKECFYGNK